MHFTVLSPQPAVQNSGKLKIMVQVQALLLTSRLMLRTGYTE